MKLLVLTNNPVRPSFRQRIGIYLQTLEKGGIRCKVIKLPSGESARFRLFKQAVDFDAVFLQKKCLNLFDAFSLRRYSRKIIYDFDDAIMYSTKHPQRNSFSHFRLFRRTAKLADMIIAGNPYLAEHARKFNQNVYILPTGLDTNEYSRQIKKNNNRKIRLIWIGSKSTLKYLAEIKPALEELGARFPNVVLRIICDDFFELEHMETEKHLWSLKTQAPDLAECDIGLTPLPDNRFTRGKCGFKALQYAAAALPVVASPVGVHSEYIIEGLTGFLAEDSRQWTEKISLLIKDADLRKKLGTENLNRAKQFDMNMIGKQLADLIANCLGSG